MKVIDDAFESKKFAGKIVMFQFSSTNPCNFLRLSEETTWPKPEKFHNCHFGYISRLWCEYENGSEGHCMNIFMGEKDIAHNCDLTNKNIAETELKMREATTKEIRMLKKIYKAGKGRFPYFNWPDL